MISYFSYTSGFIEKLLDIFLHYIIYQKSALVKYDISIVSWAVGCCCGTSPHGGTPERPTGSEQNKG